MKKVLSGIRKFQNEVLPERKALFDRLATGQNPPILFVTCADSRIDLNLVTQTDPGYLFICRNAGNIVPPHSTMTGGITASIEYAVAVLGVKHAIVCGHTDCGAIRAATHLDELASLPHVRSWLTHCQAAIASVRHVHGAVDEEHLLDLIRENVLVQMQNMRTHPEVAARLRTHTLKLHGWVYNIETGEVDCYDQASDTWTSVLEREAELTLVD